jgi:hypothetical protein
MKNPIINENAMKLLDNKELHRLIHKVVEVILSYATQDPKDYSRPYLRFSKNADMDGTCMSFTPQLIFVNGRISSIECPWGCWDCFDAERLGDGWGLNDDDAYFSSGPPCYDWQKYLPELVSRLGLVFNYYDDYPGGHIVRYYILKVDNEPIPWCEKCSEMLTGFCENEEEDAYYLDTLEASWEQHEENRKKDA